MAEIVPSIIAKTPEEFSELIKKLEPFTPRVHFDVMDGVFVPDKTVTGFDELKNIQTPLIFDVHLMTAYPQSFIPQWLQVPNTQRITLCHESQGNLMDMINQIKGANRLVGISLNPETPVDSVLEYLTVIDYIQFMTVHPGRYGAPFLPEMSEKIYTFHSRYPDTIIAVDGGMNPETAKLMIKDGAQIIISGSYILKSEDVGKAIKELKNEI